MSGKVQIFVSLFYSMRDYRYRECDRRCGHTGTYSCKRDDEEKETKKVEKEEITSCHFRATMYPMST
jgi:hypothetical protein